MLWKSCERELFEIPSLSRIYMLNSEPAERSLCHVVVNRAQVCLELILNLPSGLKNGSFFSFQAQARWCYSPPSCKISQVLRWSPLKEGWFTSLLSLRNLKPTFLTPKTVLCPPVHGLAPKVVILPKLCHCVGKNSCSSFQLSMIVNYSYA